MSADEQLSPEQFKYFHATDVRLRQGEMLTPFSARTGSRQNRLSRRSPGYSPDHVYLYRAESDAPAEHGLFAHFGRHTYEVEPLGAVEADPEGSSDRAFRTSRAKVIRRLNF